MEIKTELNPMFSYSPVKALILGILLFIMIIILNKKKNKKKNEKNKIAIPEKKEENIKEKYLEKLEELKEKTKTQTEKESCQELSKLIRNFVYEKTNILVQYYTLKEIETLNIPALEELIRVYYEQEFQKDSTKDIKEIIEKTREVIEKWN